MRKQQRRLPDGTYTRSVKKYIDAWSVYTAAASRILGLPEHSFDPCVVLRSDMPRHPLMHLSPETIDRLIDLERRALSASEDI